MINEQNFVITFGDNNSSPFSMEEFHLYIDNKKEILRNKIKNVNKNDSFFLHQIHSTDGLILKEENFNSFEKKGDFIITNLKNICIGVLTADCLPIIYYDTVNQIAAISHAGWKGTLKNIAAITFEQMKKNFNSNATNIKVFFGPSAKACCYEIDNDFYNNFERFKDQTFNKINNKFHFDLPLYNKLILEEAGIKNIVMDNNFCTICNDNFCSARRQKNNSRRQMTTIMLK